MNATATLEPVGVREAKARFSSLTEAVNELGASLTVLKNNRPWVVIQPADTGAAERRRKLEAFRALTASIEAEKPAGAGAAWGSIERDRELLGEERVRRFG